MRGPPSSRCAPLQRRISSLLCGVVALERLTRGHVVTHNHIGTTTSAQPRTTSHHVNAQQTIDALGNSMEYESIHVRVAYITLLYAAG
mmetsp:Transcript_61468/g.145369  ORF Transcript_61468/g.145369 Transcript_61468/m.145369 type:complete len:88 (-) Transcript_61468:321-584(-)